MRLYGQPGQSSIYQWAMWLLWPETVDYARASGECVCDKCGLLYYEHPMDGPGGWPEGRQWLHRLCNGKLVKT